MNVLFIKKQQIHQYIGVFVLLYSFDFSSLYILFVWI